MQLCELSYCLSSNSAGRHTASGSAKTGSDTCEYRSHYYKPKCEVFHGSPPASSLR
jgi:hypothetical protein